MNDARNSGTDLGRLMQAAQTGNEAAYLNLLKQISSVVRSAVRRQARGLQHADIEDIVQDVLVSVHLVRATYDPSRPFLPWLLTIVHNRLIDRYRKLTRQATKERLFGETAGSSRVDAFDLGTDAYGDEVLLQRAIRALPKAQRQAIELVKLREMSLKDAADQTGTTVGNMKVVVHRAIKNLRKKMGASDDH